MTDRFTWEPDDLMFDDDEEEDLDKREVNLLDHVNKIGARHSKTDTGMIQEMHDHSVKLGAKCPMMDKSAPVATDVHICKLDESLGLVMGFAVVCKVNGEDYFDLNIDKNGERVPEHIPEEAMLKSAADFMINSRLGNEMHSGPDVGTYVFAFPLTTEIAKAMGIQTNKTGLMVAYKPTPEVFAKYRDGTYTGFSIEGRRVKTEES